MPFEDDKILNESMFAGEKDTTVILQIVQRADGPTKVQLGRFKLNNGQREWKKLGRLSLLEAFRVRDRLATLLKDYDEPKHDPDEDTDSAQL